MGDLTISVTITDTATQATETFTDTVPADIAEDVKDGAWTGATTDEQQQAIPEPAFKQKAWAVAQILFTAWRHRHRQVVRHDPRYKPPDTPSLTDDPPQ